MVNTYLRTLAALTMAVWLATAVVASAEVVGVTITARTPVADGRVFGARGTYEQLTGRIEFALDPADPHNRGIVDLEYAPRDAQGRVHYTSDLYVVQPTDAAKGNGVMLFEVANRGGKGQFLAMFGRGAGNDPTTAAGAGDGFLMHEGYTLVWVGWEFDVPATALRLAAPPLTLPAGVHVDPLSVDFVANERVTDTFIIDEPLRPPVVFPPLDPASPTDRLTVRKTFWDAEVTIPRERWRFLPGASLPKVQFDDGFEPGLLYRVTYRPAFTVVSGAGFAAMRDAAAAFRQRTDLPVHGTKAYVYGNSQTGRFLRTFLHEGFNVDEHDRRVFDAMWIHIAGAARGFYNRRFATPSHGDPFAPTQFPFADADETDVDGSRGGLQSRYRPEQRPKVFYTNTPVEYWGGGRAAALIHTSVDGTRDLVIPENVRIYLISGAQHLPFPFPPDRRSVAGPNGRNGGQQLSNPLPQKDIMRALLRAFHQWASEGVAPPPSQYPRLRDKTLVALPAVKFPALPGVTDPRTIVGPGRTIGGKMVPLPFLVPQVDQDGNDLAGIRDPELAVPLATYTGWNFRDARTGNPEDISQLLGSYIPLPRTRDDGRQRHDPRRSIAERYRDLDDYMGRIAKATDDSIRRRFLLADDRAAVLARAEAHWQFAVTPGRFLAAWTGDADRRNPDFLAILDVTPREPRYGRVVATLPVGFSALDPHHTEHALDQGRILFANGYAGDRSFRFDLRQPERPQFLGPLATTADVHYLHSFVRAPGGRILATYQAEGPDREGAGGIAEFSQDGRLIRKSSARVDGIEPALLRPYSLAVVPDLDRIVVGCSAMLFPAAWDEPHATAMRTQMEHEHRGIHVQVYRLSDLKLLDTIVLPDPTQDGRITGAKEPRLLADGHTVLMSTGQGALFKIDHLESRPAITRVFTFGGERCACGVPVVVGRFWIQPMANAHSLLALDVADPDHPKEVSRVRLGDRLLPHWLSWDADEHRLIVADSGAPGGEHRLWIVAVDPTTGHLEVDRRFGNPGSDEPGFSFDLAEWPHGATGPAVPHGTVFVP